MTAGAIIPRPTLVDVLSFNPLVGLCRPGEGIREGVALKPNRAKSDANNDLGVDRRRISVADEAIKGTGIFNGLPRSYGNVDIFRKSAVQKNIVPSEYDFLSYARDFHIFHPKNQTWVVQ